MAMWQIFGAVALRRLPEVIPAPDLVQLRVQQIFSAWEVARSRLSKHEFDNLRETTTEVDPDDKLSSQLNEKTQDMLDRWNKELDKFKPAPYQERLSKIEYLFLNHPFASDTRDQWLLPQACYDANLDSNLIDTCRRALRDSLGIINGYRIVSKVPSSNYSFRYPKPAVQATGCIGARVFFLKAHLDQPSAEIQKALSDMDKLRWMTTDEAKASVHSRYIKSLLSGLFPEVRVDTSKILGRAAICAESYK